MLRFVLASIAISIPLLAHPGFASIAKPIGGTVFEITLDEVE